MLETAMAQLRFAASMLSGRSFSPWSLEQLVRSLRATAAEFGTIGAGSGEMVSGPAMDAATREELQLRRLRAQAMKAKDTPYYAHLFGALGFDPSRIKSQADVALIPITGKDSVREQPDAFVRRGSRPYLRAQTTGTTGSPTSIAFSSHELRVYCALQAIAHLLSGDIQADDVVLVSTSGRGVLGNLCLAGACAHVGAIVAMGGLIDPAATLARLAEKQSLPGKRDRVSVLYTYPSYLGELVECGLRLGYRPHDFGLRLVAAGGEIVTEGLRRRSRELFGEVRYTEGYGMTEIWPFGGQLCEQGHLHFEAIQGLVELVDPDTGAPTPAGDVGAIVATPFPPFRETTLLLRYNTEDMVQRLAQPPACSLKAAPATGLLLGKRRLAVRHDNGWTYPRPVLEALESLPEVPLPARCGFWPGPGGVAVEVVATTQSAAVRRKVAAVLEAQGVPLCELYLVEQARDLCHPFPLRGDLREPELAARRPSAGAGTAGAPP